MAQTPNTSLTLTQTVPVFYSKTLLDRLVQEFFFYDFGQKKSIPKHGGKIIVWTRYDNFDATTTELSEGVTPDALALSANNVSAELKQHGKHVIISDLLSQIAIDDTTKSSVELLGYQGGLSIDTICRNVLSAGTEQIADGKSAVSDLAVSNIMDGTETRKAVRTLGGLNVQKHPKSPGFYAGFVHQNTAYDLKGDTTTGSWVDVQKNFKEGAKLIETNKIGDLYGVRFWETSNLETVSSTTTTYNNLIMGMGAYGVVRLMGGKRKNLETIIKKVGSAGADDPLNQRGSVGWKALFVPKLLDAQRVIVVKTGATA